MLIDGGVIANNPAMYAYLHSQFANNQTNIRLISIGTGETPPTKFEGDTVNKFDWLFQIGALISTVEANTHNYLLK